MATLEDSTPVDLHKGGKQDNDLSRINQQFLNDIAYRDIEELEDKLNTYKKQFMEIDLDDSGDLNLMEVKQMMEKLGQAKTHLELRKMIAEVDRTGTGVICYQDFVLMMLGKKSSILKLILMSEEKNKAKARDLSALP